MDNGSSEGEILESDKVDDIKYVVVVQDIDMPHNLDATIWENGELANNLSTFFNDHFDNIRATVIKSKFCGAYDYQCLMGSEFDDNELVDDES